MKLNKFPAQRFCVAPMLHWTDRHCRYFHRQLSKYAQLYTEMVTTNAMMYSKKDHLIYHEKEHPIVLQLAGNNPIDLAKCAKKAEIRGYDEINFNIGCPSMRVKKGGFGVCLMRHAKLVADCVSAMRKVVKIPVTIKTRTGLDNDDHYEFLYNFIKTVSNYSDCHVFIIHARKALLSGINTKKNRIIPELKYEYIYQLKRDFMSLIIVLNGGIKKIIDIQHHLKHVDGVMIGREAYHNPILLTEIDSQLFHHDTLSSVDPFTIIRSMYPYIQDELAKGTCLGHITRHFIGLFKNTPNATYFRRYLSKHAYNRHADIEVLENAIMLLKY